jgi:hydroxypyruvate reductase
VADVRELLAKYDLAAKLPASIRTFFEREDMPESPGNKKWRPQFLSKRPWTGAAPVRNITAAATMSGEHEAFQDSVFELLLSSHDLVENARAQAQEKGFYVTVDNSCDDWDYADAARYLLKLFHSLRATHERLCLISVGEVTVRLNRTPGAGGRNQQFALDSALDLQKYPGERLVVFSAGSDGIDGNTPSAGAIADPTTVERAHAFGFDPEQALAAFNVCPLFTALGDAVVTGPTGQNLRDLRLLIAEKD